MLDDHGVELLHLDCKDNPQVFIDAQYIKTLTKTNLDVHLITSNPEQYFNVIKTLQPAQICFQWEPLLRYPQLPELKGTRKGIALKTETSLDVLEQAAGWDYVMLMSTVPGESGGRFQKETFSRIHEVHRRFPSLKIQVDGGVNEEVAFILRLLNIESFVSGSYLMNHEHFGHGLLSFYRIPKTEISFCVSDFMLPLTDLPIVSPDDDFKVVLEVVEQYRQGYAMVVKNDQLYGVISNADIRRGVLRHYDRFQNIKASDVMNRNPVTVKSDASVTEMLQTIQEHKFVILFLPVVDRNNNLKGSILLNHLTHN